MGYDELINLGFSSHEAEIYLCLLSRGPIGGNSISKMLKLNRTLVYHVLKTMQKKFMVTCSLNRPTVFSAVPIGTVIDHIVENKKLEAVYLNGKKSMISDVLASAINSNLTSFDDRFDVFEGRVSISTRFFDELKEVNSEFLFAYTDLSLRLEDVDAFVIVIKNADKRKIKSRILTYITPENLKLNKDVLKMVSKSKFCQVRNLSAEFLSLPLFYVVDDNLGVCVDRLNYLRHLPDRNFRAIRTNNVVLLDAFRLLFERAWASSTDFKETIGKLDRGLPIGTSKIEN